MEIGVLRGNANIIAKGRTDRDAAKQKAAAEDLKAKEGEDKQAARLRPVII